MLLLGIVLVLGALVIGLLMLTTAGAQSRGVARSLELLERQPTQREVSRHELPARDRLVNPLLDATKSVAVRLSPSGTADRIATALDRAGNPAGWSVERIFGVKGIGLLIGVGLGLLFGGISLLGLLLALTFGALFFFMPDLLVYNAALRRKEQVRRGLADALDMLTVCVEAGQGFDAALLQVARSADGPIAGEFARALSEIQIGRTRGEAFTSLGERSTAPEVKNFVSALVQADRLGLPIARVLREQTAQMRLVRRQRAEEKAQRVTVTILFPLLLCIFPALMIVIIGPGAIRLVDVFTNQL